MPPSAQALALVLALLHLRPPVGVRRCVQARAPGIATALDGAAAAAGLRPSLVLAVAWLETHAGCDRGEGGGWGAPVGRGRRHVAGTALHHGRALAWGLRRCGTEGGAVAHYRCGLCSCTPRRGYLSGTAVRLAGTLEALAR